MFSFTKLLKSNKIVYLTILIIFIIVITLYIVIGGLRRGLNFTLILITIILLSLILSTIKNLIYQRIFRIRFISNNFDFVKAFILEGYSLREIRDMLDWIINDLVILFRKKSNLYDSEEKLITDCKNEILTIYRNKYKYDNISTELVNSFIKEFMDKLKISPKKYL